MNKALQESKVEVQSNHHIDILDNITMSAVIPLNTKDPSLHWWHTRIPESRIRPNRTPGVIGLNRYPAVVNYMGIPTFLAAPVAFTPLDLRAARVDVAIIGAPLDTSTGVRGAGYGPRFLRAGFANYAVSGGPSMETMVDWQSELKVVDYGDAAIDYLSVERSMGPVRELVREIAGAGAIPVIIGGDHSLEYCNVAGIADVYGKENVGVIHLDAHFDAQTWDIGHLISHSAPVKRLIEEGHVRGRNYMQVGLRGVWPGARGFQWMRYHGMRYHTMVEVERDGWATVMQRVLEEAREGTKYLYISLDMDVLDPAFAPGTGTPEPGGMTPRELFPLLRMLCAERNVVGFDVVEYNPLTDPGYTTGIVADRAIRSCLTGIAMHRKGIKSDFLSPLTVSDER